MNKLTGSAASHSTDITGGGGADWYFDRGRKQDSTYIALTSHHMSLSIHVNTIIIFIPWKIHDL